MAFSAVKEECFGALQRSVKLEPGFRAVKTAAAAGASVVDISSSSSESSGGDARSICAQVSNSEGEVTPLSAIKTGFLYDQIAGSAGPSAKRPRTESIVNVQTIQRTGPDGSLSYDFFQPLTEDHQRSFSQRMAITTPPSAPRSSPQNIISKPFRQFWKAGDYETDKSSHKSTAGGMDHARVHPKFLHSNATSHKWALGAIAELLDNAVDEIVHGATFVKVEKIQNPKNGEPMLLIEDDGGGMNPDSMRQCMSLGYSAKSKIANTIGQYGNGFKTSTMRLGADVVVFSRCQGNKGRGPTQSVGMLSYTFLRETGQEDIIVPMIDYEIQPFGLRKLIRSNVDDWARNMESIQYWSPYATEAKVLDHFKEMKTQGTKIIIYNLWEDDQGQLELEFNADMCDIQLRGVNRDEKHITMADRFPNARHYLTYQHSLRIYASILYLKLPPGFRMFLRGKEIEHHDLINDLMFTEVWTYRPVASDLQTNTSQMKAVVTVGFVKDAKAHIDVQGFNVYHKNRLIKPFWRLWNSAASRGRGIIGVLEANFVEPAHDKQGFERTIVLARLEARLIEMQKTYWSRHCQKVGYVNVSLRGKDGKAAGLNMRPLGLEDSPPTLAIPLSMSTSLHTPLSATPLTRPCTSAGSYPAFYVGHAFGAQNVRELQALARSQQLQPQNQLAGQANPAKEVNFPVMQQAVPVGILPHRHNALTGNHTPPSNLFEMVSGRPQEQLPSHPPNASRSPLPQPSSMLSMSQQPETVDPYNVDQSPFPQPSLGMASSSQRPDAGSQTIPLSRAQPNGVLQAQQTAQPSTSPMFAAQSLSLCSTAAFGRTRAESLVARVEGTKPAVGSIDLNFTQTSPVHSIMQAGDGKDLLPNFLGHTTSFVEHTREPSAVLWGEVLRLAAGSPPSPRNSATMQSCTSSPLTGEVAIHAPDNHGESAGPVPPSTEYPTMSGTVLIDEECQIHASDVFGVKGNVHEVNMHNDQNLQSFSDSASCITPKAAQALALKGVKVSVPVESYASPLTFADLSGNPHISPGTMTQVSQALYLPSEQGTPCTLLGIDSNALRAPQVPLEQGFSNVSIFTGKETNLGQNPLENLGHMFAKKAASVAMDQCDHSKDVKPPLEELTECGVNIRGMLQSGSQLELQTHIVSNQQLEACLVVMQVEVTSLQQKLNVLKIERDSLRLKLLEGRLQGRLGKQELQLKVEQTWAKVRELEAKHGGFFLIQGGSTD